MKKYNIEKDSDEDDEDSVVDSKIQRELHEIQKIQDSAMVKCIVEDVSEQVGEDVVYPLSNTFTRT